MKIYPIQFSIFPYYEHLQIVHLFDTILNRKNIIETLWRILDGRSDKEKILKICTDIKEGNHAMWSVINENSDGDLNSLSWLLTKKQSNYVKEVIRRIKLPIGFASNINNILTKKGDFGGAKTHNCHTFIKILYFTTFVILWYIHYFLVMYVCL